jgi:uncharacterized protein YndB with AHSA1/START domain
LTGHVIHIDRHIYATPEQVWRVLTDVEGLASTLRSIDHVERLSDDDDFGVGTLWREDRTLMGHRGTEVLEVTEAQPPRHFAVRTSRDKDVVTLTYSVTPLAEGCRLSLTLVDEILGRNPASRLAWTLWGEVSMHSTRRMLVHDLQDVALAAESMAISGT